MQKQQTFVERVYAWNQLRYEAKSDELLTTALLAEELEELCQAQDEVEALDAIGDVLFVAIGGLYKLGLPLEATNAMFDQFMLEYRDMPPTAQECFLACHFKTRHLLDYDLQFKLMSTFDDVRMVSTITNTIFNIIIPILTGFERYYRLVEIMDAICSSNESKAVPQEKVDPSIKANAGPTGKGPNYVPPTADLKKIADSFKDNYGGKNG